MNGERELIIREIAGGVGGGVTFILVVLVFFFRRYRKKHGLVAEPSIPLPDPDFVCQPYPRTAQSGFPHYYESTKFEAR